MEVGLGGEEDVCLRRQACHSFILSEFAPYKQSYYYDLEEQSGRGSRIGRLKTQITSFNYPRINSRREFTQKYDFDFKWSSSFMKYYYY